MIIDRQTLFPGFLLFHSHLYHRFEEIREKPKGWITHFIIIGITLWHLLYLFRHTKRSTALQYGISGQKKVERKEIIVNVNLFTPPPIKQRALTKVENLSELKKEQEDIMKGLRQVGLFE
ncbi:unnamed protein product, partial [Mesorhabditis belari]|uniref:Uncharacterized protein n=1 Tax=Mesorhabditis belari TaxID=2138241 RepID=A0AAF3EZQ4_9BILA